MRFYAVLEENEVLFILGNHDEYLLRDSLDGLNPLLRSSVDYTRTKITKNNLEELRKTPPFYNGVIDGMKIQMYHGSPWNFFEEYIYPNYRHFERFNDSNTDLIILGHTHIPFIGCVNETMIVNPGSCGQPRDNDPRASYGILQTENNKITINRVKYDTDKVVEAARVAGINPIIIDMLKRNKLKRARE